jgi:hypothetical protein
MSGNPAAITQADVQRAIRAARKEGVAKIEVRIRDAASLIIHISEEKHIAPGEQIVL